MSYTGYALYALGRTSIVRDQSAGTNTAIVAALFCLTLLISGVLSARMIPPILRHFPTRVGKSAIAVGLFGAFFAGCWLAGLLVVTIAQPLLSAHGVEVTALVTVYGYLCLSVVTPCALLEFVLLALGIWRRRKSQYESSEP